MKRKIVLSKRYFVLAKIRKDYDYVINVLGIDEQFLVAKRLMEYFKNASCRGKKISMHF